MRLQGPRRKSRAQQISFPYVTAIKARMACVQPISIARHTPLLRTSVCAWLRVLPIYGVRTVHSGAFRCVVGPGVFEVRSISLLFWGLSGLGFLRKIMRPRPRISGMLETARAASETANAWPKRTPGWFGTTRN